MSNDVKEWIINWFVNNTNVSNEELVQHLNDSYFDLGYIDSFQFISFIGDIEDELGVQFDNDQFEDRSFSTIEGLSRIIEDLKK